MKISQNAKLLLFGSGCLMLSLTGLFYAFFYSWLLSTPGVPAKAQQQYELIAQTLGVLSIGLLLVALGALGRELYRAFHRRDGSVDRL